MHPSSMRSCSEFLVKYLGDKTEDKLLIADVGSYDVNGTYRELIEANPNWKYIGIDIMAGPNVDVVVPEVIKFSYASFSAYGDWYRQAGSVNYDVVISGQCLEHVRKPWQWIKQVASILKSGGLVFITAPNTWVYHEYPIDCWRVWPDGMRALFDEADIECLEAYITGEPDKPYDTVGIGRKL